MIFARLLRFTHVHRFIVYPLLVSTSLFVASSVAQNSSAASSPALESVLNQMDAAASNFRTAEADFKADTYQKVVNETDTQTGKIYFRRSGKGDLQMASHFQAPEEKYVVYSDGKIRVYQPKIEQINEYDAGKNRSEIETFMLLGFGGGGHDLTRHFDVQFAGNEDVDGVKTAKLELVPKDPKVKNMFDKMVIWVDPVRAISLKQQFFEPSGDYRITHYSNIKVNTKIPDDVFKLHTTGHIKTVKDK
jgi:outer membrane lipoprotein-sorting protein